MYKSKYLKYKKKYIDLRYKLNNMEGGSKEIDESKIKKFLAVILFHNDEHLVEEQVNYMIDNKHDIIIFNHNSNDETQNIIDDLSKKHSRIIKTYILDSSIPFKNNGVFNHISNILIEQYSNKYDWISFIESDEFLEGPKRDKKYYEYLLDVSETEYTYIQFDNILFWPTKDIDESIKSIRERLKYYAWFKNCGPRLYAWKAKYTNLRNYNHNPPSYGNKYPIHFNTCHYPFTSKTGLLKKLDERRKMSQSNGVNTHYKHLFQNIDNLIIDNKLLHYNDNSDLIKDDKFDFSKFYN
tara:strand:+ start:374 stop:1261 length:888 start_codon:yes stop_codon:yes gene_type:complete